MKRRMTWSLAALAAVVGVNSASANELRFTDLEQRLRVVERQLDEQQGVRAAAYDDEAIPASPETGSAAGYQRNSGACCDDSCYTDYHTSGGAYYGEAQVLWIRPHVNQDWVGKLSERHEISARYILGYEDCSGLGVRARYWNFDHTIGVIDPAQIGMRINTVDIEVTNRVSFRSTDVLLGGGFRYAGWELADDNGDDVELDGYGLTMAADARTPLCCYAGGQWSIVYGGRLSILGGDWHGDNDIIDTIGNPAVADDNLLVTELSAGVEYLFGGMFARATVEMQNWRSDVLAEPGIGNGIAPFSIGSTSSIGFIGMGFHVGAAF